jgi:hypothetical protein
VRAFGLASTADLPIAAEFRYGQFSLDCNSKGTEALAVVAVEADSRLIEAVPSPPWQDLNVSIPIESSQST